MINAGNYRHRIIFLQITETYNDYGELTDTWVPFKKAYARKDPLLGNEYFTALTVNSKVEVKFNMRYIKGVTNDMRIQHGKEIYEILSAINVKGLKTELSCYCKLLKD